MPDLMGSGKNDGIPRVSLGTHPSHTEPLTAPCPIFGTGEARNFKFGVRIDLGKSHVNVMHDKISPKGQKGRD